MRGMVIDMDDEQLRTLADVRGFLDGTVAMEFTVAEDERYGFIARTVKRFGYGRLKRADKAVVLRFLERVSGYSRQQIARLVKRGGERRPLLKRYRASRTSFARTYMKSLTGREFGAPDTIRTCDFHLRRVALYPSELRARWGIARTALQSASFGCSCQLAARSDETESQADQRRHSTAAAIKSL